MSLRYKTIDNLKLRNKTVLLRVDLNTEIVNNHVLDSLRFKEHAKTISELKKKKARVIILAHQGRHGKKDFTSLKKHAKILSRYTRVGFVQDVIGRKAVEAITKLKYGEALLLENIRSVKEEFAPEKRDNSLVRVLSSLADVYINDAFSVSHRNESSITAFPKILDSGVGRVMQKELGSLEKIKLKECLFILAWAKVEDNLLLLKNKNIITAGLFGQLCTIAKGSNLGAQNKFLRNELKLIPRIKPFLGRIKTPTDFAVNANGKRIELKLEDFPSKYEIFDIGEETIARYK